MRIESVQVGLPRTYGSREKPAPGAGAPGRDPDGAPAWTTAYAKRPVRGAVRVHRTNLDGDAQADRKWHGGPDMAVLAYPAAHYARWSEELSWPGIPPGAFGENLTLSGITEEEACLGDVWRAGSATLQVSEPRKPCKNISRFWQREDLLRLVVRTGRYGFYLRVLEEGDVEAGEEVRLLDRPHGDWTVARATAARGHAAERPAEAEALLRVGALGKDWQAHVRAKLEPR